MVTAWCQEVVKIKGDALVDINRLSKIAREMGQFDEQHYGAIEAARQIADGPIIQAINDLQENSPVNRLLADIERNENLIRAAQGPLEELRMAGFLDSTSDLKERYLTARNVIDEFEDRFSLPEVPSDLALIHEFHQSPVMEAMARYSTRADEIQRAMQAMSTPWLDAQETLKSVTSFTELQGMGKMLDNMPPFENSVCSALREELGDWRRKINWSDRLLTDIAAREASYIDLGFDPYLTKFPPLAFKQSTEISGLRCDPPPLIEIYGEPTPCPRDEDDEAAFSLTNEAHDWLFRLESGIRRFIDSLMTDAFGLDWPKHQLPNGLYKKWMEKRAAAEKAGRKTLPLVAYADFTDYDIIICKKDNWREVFSFYFSRQEDVRESFNRLHPIRLDTMHARPITQDDQLLLYVEVKRLTKVMSL